jgi:hypothetical protein
MNTLDEPRDFDRLVKGVAFALGLLRDPRIATLRNEVMRTPSTGRRSRTG